MIFFLLVEGMSFRSGIETRMLYLMLMGYHGISEIDRGPSPTLNICTVKQVALRGKVLVAECVWKIFRGGFESQRISYSYDRQGVHSSSIRW